MRFKSRRGQNEKKKKKKSFEIWKNIFSLQLFFGLSFGFAFPRWFVELEKALLQHFKSLKMEKNWKRSAKVFGHRQVIGHGLVYPNSHSSDLVPKSVFGSLSSKIKKFLKFLNLRRGEQCQVVLHYLDTMHITKL